MSAFELCGWEKLTKLTYIGLITGIASNTLVEDFTRTTMDLSPTPQHDLPSTSTLTADADLSAAAHETESQSRNATQNKLPVEPPLSLTFKRQGHDNVVIEVPRAQPIAEVAQRLASVTNVDARNMTIWIGLSKRLKHPFPEEPIIDVADETTKLRIVGTPASLIPAGPRTSPQRTGIPTIMVTPRRDWKRVQEDSTYTFHDIQPLVYLPDPEKSRRFLQRLANDSGIKSSMRKNKFVVGLLTEMDPSQHTTHGVDGGVTRTLGLNRNRGEAIELRLRTDRYDGYRSYNVIRTTLCHELAHNIFSEHDRSFYDLMKEIQQEVDRGDWQHGGHRLTDEEFYDPLDTITEGDIDGGGWTGGEFVLGSLEGSQHQEGLTRREILAKAAMKRFERQDKASHDDPQP